MEPALISGICIVKEWESLTPPGRDTKELKHQDPVVQKPISANPGLNILNHGIVSNLTETDLSCKVWINKFFPRKTWRVSHMNRHFFLREAMAALIFA